MKIKIIIIFLIIAAFLIIFLFPKPAGKSGSGYQAIPPSHIINWTDEECSCFGYKYDANNGLADAPHRYECIGITFSCRCIIHTLNPSVEDSETSEIVPCA